MLCFLWTNKINSICFLQMESFLQRWESMTEDQLAKSVMFKVEDQECESRGTFNKAEASLPISLSLRLTSSRFSKDEGVTGIWTNAPIPAGTRFGPIQGAKYSPGKCLFFSKFLKMTLNPDSAMKVFFPPLLPLEILLIGKLEIKKKLSPLP